MGGPGSDVAETISVLGRGRYSAPLSRLRIKLAARRLTKLRRSIRSRSGGSPMLDQFRRRDRRSVVLAYETMLGRQPESDAVVDAYARLGLERTLRSIAGSPEFQAQRQGSPFFHYNASFDARATIVRHARVDLTPHPDYLTNFLGVRIDPNFLPLDPRGPRRPGRGRPDPGELARRHRGMGCRTPLGRFSAGNVRHGRARVWLGMLDEQRREWPREPPVSTYRPHRNRG